MARLFKFKKLRKENSSPGVRYLGIAESIHKYNTFCTYFEAKLDLANNIYVWIPTYIQDYFKRTKRTF